MGYNDIKRIKEALQTIENVQSGSMNSKNPGKFEGETIATEYFYDCMNDDCEEVIKLSQVEKYIFEIENIYNYVVVNESNDGFSSLSYFSTREEAETYLQANNDWQNEEADF